MEQRFSNKSKNLATFFAFISVAALVTTPALVNANAVTVAAGSGSIVNQTQTLTISGTVVGGVVARDGYTVTSAPKPEPEVKPASIKKVSNLIFANDTAWDIQWPFPVGVPMSDGFGHRVKPCGTCSENHQGVDFLPGLNSPAQAIYEGEVLSVQDLGAESYGYHVIVRHKIHGDTVDTVYGHLVVDSSNLKVGDLVKVGDGVGLIGSTGSSTGPHLHFEVRVNGEAVDPIIWLKANVGVYIP